MATREDYIEYVCEQISTVGEVKFKKMFGEYMIYINNKPIITVCDNTPYVKEKKEILYLMKDAEKGFPYKGAKEHYILDLDNKKQVKEVISKLESITPLKNKKRN